MIDAVAMRAAMVAGLAERGELTDEWRDAFEAVARHQFIPDLIWHVDDSIPHYANLVPLHRNDDPDGWLRACYANAHVITQVDDGRPVGPDGHGFDITSSASMPAVVAVMLGALRAEPGMRVREIGTGTGYNAALLAHRLGVEQVTTIEIDPDIAAHARKALAGTGFGAVSVTTGEGGQEYPPGVPFDRVLSTASVNQVPYPWIAQTVPGGRVVTPWSTAWYNSGLLALAVGDDGTATGQLVDRASFMRLREQRVPRVRSMTEAIHHEADAAESSTGLHPWHVAHDHDGAIAVGIQVPACQRMYQPAGTHRPEGVLWLVDQASGSWASLHHHPERTGPYRVRQRGPRMLWDEVEAAYRWWTDAGCPAADHWWFTVTPSGQRIDLDPQNAEKAQLLRRTGEQGHEAGRDRHHRSGHRTG